MGTGSIVTAGGLSVAKNTYIAGTVYLQNSQLSTSSTTGALQVTGGISSSNINLNNFYNQTASSQGLDISTNSNTLDTSVRVIGNTSKNASF